MTVSRKSKEKVWKRDNYICFYCKKDLREERNLKCNQELTVDHIIAIKDGGTGQRSNLITCCRECNLKKAEKNYSKIY
jgi:5-methylcytosine-specific restriction endonuclease McrA